MKGSISYDRREETPELESGIGTASLTTVGKLLENEITIFKDIVRIDVQT
jgi:hypothetical protein